MKGDFSRLTFDPSKRYSSVRMQQGRLQIDADWNEQMDLLERRIATEITDFIGSSGTPSGYAGFNLSANGAVVTISAGRYYVAGMLIENPQDVVYTAQLDYPGAALPPTAGTYLAYLDVWQRHVTALEDPGLADPALSGADTATRYKNVWQVKLIPADPAKTYGSTWQPDESTLGTLTAKVTAPVQENQLYRVEVHGGGPASQATIKWSRDNAAIAARVSRIAGRTISLRAGGRAASFSFAVNQWIELSNDERTLKSLPGILAQIAAVKEDELTVTQDLGVSETNPWPGDAASPTNIIVRRWDSNAAIAVTAAEILMDSIKLQFSATGTYKSGDYWMLPARQLTGGIEWPLQSDGVTPVALLPRGIVHRYCALALLQLSPAGWSLRSDLRAQFRPMVNGLVNKAGDVMTGPLSIRDNLSVSGNVSVGGRVETPYLVTPMAIPNVTLPFPIVATGVSHVDTTRPRPSISANGTEVPLPTTANGDPDGTLLSVIWKLNGARESRGFNVYATQEAWNAWADWVNQTAASGDVVATASWAAISGLPANGSARVLLTQMGAQNILDLTFAAQQSNSIARRPYALVFIKGELGSAVEDLKASESTVPAVVRATTYPDLLGGPRFAVTANTYLQGALNLSGQLRVSSALKGTDKYAWELAAMHQANVDGGLSDILTLALLKNGAFLKRALTFDRDGNAFTPVGSIVSSFFNQSGVKIYYARKTLAARGPGNTGPWIEEVAIEGGSFSSPTSWVVFAQVLELHPTFGTGKFQVYGAKPSGAATFKVRFGHDWTDSLNCELFYVAVGT
jgi:hypothetical protein